MQVKKYKSMGKSSKPNFRSLASQDLSEMNPKKFKNLPSTSSTGGYEHVFKNKFHKLLKEK
jgi:hypothetical protein